MDAVCRRPTPAGFSAAARGCLAADTVQVTSGLTVGQRALLDVIIDQVRAEPPGIVTRTEIAVVALKLAPVNTPG